MLAAGYVVEQAIYLCVSAVFICISGFQIFFVWPRNQSKVRITQKLNVVPIFVLNILIAIISIDVRCVYGLYTPSFLVCLTYIAVLSVTSPIPRWSLELAKVKADELNLDISSMGIYNYVIFGMILVSIIYAIVSCSLVLVTRKMVYGSTVLFVVFAFAVGALVPLFRLHWMIRRTRINMIKSGTMGDATAKRSYEIRVLRNNVMASTLTFLIFSFGLFLCLHPYFKSVDVDTLLLTQDPTIYTVSPVVTIFLFLGFSASLLFCHMGWISRNAAERNAQIAPIFQTMTLANHSNEAGL
jgi:hypothetical protein